VAAEALIEQGFGIRRRRGRAISQQASEFASQAFRGDRLISGGFLLARGPPAGAAAEARSTGTHSESQALDNEQARPTAARESCRI